MPQAINRARGEAKCLIRLLNKNGNTLDSVRDLIRVAPEEEAILRAFALQCPELASHIERALAYRIRVEEEFERLVRGLRNFKKTDCIVGGEQNCYATRE